MVIERLCRRYKKLPSEILEEDQDWIEQAILIMKYENKRKELEHRRIEQRSKVMSH